MCATLIEPACAVVSHVIASATASAAGDGVSGLADATGGGLRWAVQNTAAWWVTIPSPNLASEPAITAIQAWLLPVTAAVAVAGMIGAGVRMAIARRANPLLDVTGGLLTLAAATTVGTVVPALLIKAGDAWSAWVLQVSSGGQFGQRLAGLLVLGNSAAPAVVLIFGTIAIVLALVQAVLMLFPQAALVILAGVLPLAAARAIAPVTPPRVRQIPSGPAPGPAGRARQQRPARHRRSGRPGNYSPGQGSGGPDRSSSRRAGREGERSGSRRDGRRRADRRRCRRSRSGRSRRPARRRRDGSGGLPMTPDHDQVRSYGGWRRTRSVGLLGLGTLGTLVLLRCFAALLLRAAFSLKALLYIGPPVVLAGAAGAIPVRGAPPGPLPRAPPCGR